MTQPLQLRGCRHDILGHYLKGIGLLRVLAKCTDKDHRDSDAEAWWDLENACFCLLSPRYSTREKLVEFFERHYQPTPFFSAWNTGGGMHEKKEIELSIPQSSWNEFWANNSSTILLLISDDQNQKNSSAEVRLGEQPLRFALSASLPELKAHPDIEVKMGASKGKKSRPVVEFSWSTAAIKKFSLALEAHRSELDPIVKSKSNSKSVEIKFNSGKPVLCFDIQNEAALAKLRVIDGVNHEVRVKEHGKKAVMARLEKEASGNAELTAAFNLGREFFLRFREVAADERILLEQLRELSPETSAEAFDAVFTTRAGERTQDNPLFLNRGDAGQAEIFRTFWVNFIEAKENLADCVAHGLFGESSAAAPTKDGKGAPFFPDAIKSYNIGSSWVVENYPFNALDYVLAVEGAFAMRGSVGRTLAANARRFAAFPFVFEAGEEMVDDSGEVKDLSDALWLPLWNRPVTFAELSSFVTDSQARLPSKEARFSAEFMRALYCQGVDAGFAGWQEFRFKMKASRVPWITTGAYLEPRFREDATRLNRALQPLDENRFLDQFEIRRKGNKADPQSPHPLGAAINGAMEVATRETAPRPCLELLHAVFAASRKMAVSETFRKMLPGGPRFFRPLPMEEWNALFADLDEPEFRIARAVASIVGRQKQTNGNYSEVLPMLGSLLSLKLGQTGWYLPLKGDRSYQAVWTATNVCQDLAAVLARRYLDSLTDDRPALVSSFGAPLRDVLAFLRGELDDHLIARWIEALSLIGWRLDKVNGPLPERETYVVPIEYAALRTLIELECERRKEGDTKKRRSEQPIALLCQRSASTLPLAVTEALRWISIWGVPNPDRNTRAEKERLKGRDIIDVSTGGFHLTVSDSKRMHFASRLAAAVCVPLHWCETETLFREVSLPQANT